MTHESVRSIVHRLSQSLDGVELVVKATLDELGHDSERLRGALAELLPDYCGTQIRNDRNTGRKPNRSAKVTSIRDWHARFLTLQLHVESGYRRMADCTKQDLLFGASERRTQAEATLRTAAELERLADAMDKFAARVVSDLEPDVVREAVEGTATPIKIRRTRKAAS